LVASATNPQDAVHCSHQSDGPSCRETDRNIRTKITCTDLPPTTRARLHCASRAVTAERVTVRQRCEHACPQEFVLLAAPTGSIRWPSLHLPTDDDLAGVELVSGEIDYRAVEQSIPVVVADLRLTGEDLAEDQVSAEQILDHQRGHSALTPGRVVVPPVFKVVRITGVRSPAGPQHRSQQLQAQHRQTIA
jgi:hypothetical protein